MCHTVSWPLLHDVQHISFSSHCICMSWQLLQVRHDLYIRVMRSAANAIEFILVSLYVPCHLLHVRYDLYIRVGTIRRGRGVIVVSIVPGGGEVCIAYTSVLVNLWNPKHVLGYLYE